MAKFLVHGAYSVEGAKGLLKDGGSKRRSAIKDLIEKAGGRLESLYFAFGRDDFFLVVDLPDNATAAAVSLAVAASGAATAQTVVLMTPEEVDAATKKTVAYRPPGT